MAKKKANTSKVSVPTPKTETQKLFINAIRAYSMVIASGPAGTGKSFLTASYAADFLRRGVVKKIVITRPTVPTGRSIGFFPGSLDDKMLPWVKPILDTIEEVLGKGAVECHRKNGNIEIVPFETLRGRSFEDTFVILDEAQNCSIEEVKAFVTRGGENSTVVVNGDVTQTDIARNCNGLAKLIELVRSSKALSKFVSVVEFDSDDIVRSGMCQLWVEAFEQDHRRGTIEELPVLIEAEDTQEGDHLLN